MTDRKTTDSDALTKGIADLTEAALGVGVALGRTVAEATTRGPVEAPPGDGQGALGDMIHYGVTIVRNVVGLVFSAAGTAADQAGAAFNAKSDDAGSRDKPARGPSVHQGSTLRIPLSVENTSPDAMPELEFQCLDINASDLGAGTPVGGEHFRFAPTQLNIAARDFEKLTLFIDAPEDAATGHYRAVVGVGDGRVQLAVSFSVLPKADS